MMTSRDHVVGCRLHHGGVRSANNALHAAVVIRPNYDARTRVYMKKSPRKGSQSWRSSGA